MTTDTDALSIIVVGASGDLAKKKIFPALFSLYCQNFLPDRFNILGFSRTKFKDSEFRASITKDLTCRYVPGESCADKMNSFLARCSYVSGQYDSADSFLNLYRAMRGAGEAGSANRMFYLAVPPSVFSRTIQAIGNAGLVSCGPDSAWSRVVVEKPFGRDRASSDVLTDELASVFTEEQVYRIDHYLGKEVIQNLLVLRFANLVFEPIWNRTYIEAVHIDWKEDIGVGTRGGYFDSYGIIRDVVQNHLLQILALIAMEKPVSADSWHVGDAKIEVLKRVRPPSMQDLVLGQYGAGERNGTRLPGYREEPSVRDDSLTPTYARTVLKVENARWAGVPFIITAGKGLDARFTEVRIRFREMPENIFCDSPQCLPPNQLVIRIQPDEAIYLRVVNKVPGLEMVLKEMDLDLRYALAFAQDIPEAYERLLLDVIQGDKSLFIRSDELAAAWDIFTPVLHEIEEKSIQPELYGFGTPGPAAAAGPATSGQAANEYDLQTV